MSMQHRLSTRTLSTVPALRWPALCGLAMCSLIVLLQPVALAASSQDVVVLDFDLKDVTLAPEVNAETERVKALQPLMSDELLKTHDLQVVATPDSAKDAAELGVGYLYDHPPVAARLGEEAGARWVITGRLYKPTHLFVYLKAQLIDVEQERVAGDFSVEIKGAQERLTHKGVESLALQIANAIESLQ